MLIFIEGLKLDIEAIKKKYPNNPNKSEKLIERISQKRYYELGKRIMKKKNNKNTF
jgi:hypothetical protein